MTIITDLDNSFKRRQTSYKMATILAILEGCSPEGTIHIDHLTKLFKKYYEYRANYNKPIETEKSDMKNVRSLTENHIKSLLIKNPISALRDFIIYDSDTELVKFHDELIKELTTEKITEIRKVAYKHLYQYYKEIEPYQLTLEELINFPVGTAVSATDVAHLSGYNQVKGIHPINKDDYKGVIVLCTIGGQFYANQWLNNEKSSLKYYLEGRTDSNTGQRTYNANLPSNKSIIDSKIEGYSIHVFVRDKKGEPFHYEGNFLYESMEIEESGDYYFKLEREENSEVVNMITPDIRNEEIPKDNIENVVQNIIDYIASKGFTYEPKLIKNFFLSLKTKPFVILAGISGTGKSKLVELFAEALGASSDNEQYEIIPVRPDWNDSSDILGYKNLEGRFQPGVLTKVIQRAINNADKPYFVCLDEMNLARVEYYFSDFLSLLETRKLSGEEIKSQKLFKVTDFVFQEDKEQYSNLYIPQNLYIIGTVNMDETTHPMSKKVLDRANTIEFTDVILNNYRVNDTISQVQNVDNGVLMSEYIVLKDALEENSSLVDDIVDKLVSINEILQRANLHVGYRVRDEICFYLIYNDRYHLMNIEDALDWQLLQKILPRIQGSSQQIYKVLKDLFSLCTGCEIENNYEGAAEEAENYLSPDIKVKWPKSAWKICYMLRRFEEDGFTSFWA